MKKNSIALAAALTLAVSAMPLVAQAGSKVKCYGISKAGANDCGNAAGTHSCAGNAKTDYSGQDWKGLASKDACLKAKGKIEPFKGINSAYGKK